MSNHALLSASSSHRWINCPPSARLCENYEDKSSDYAAEGTDAHSLCEYKLKRALGSDAQDPTEKLSYYNEEMEDCANGYTAFVMELVEAAKEKSSDPIALIEQRLDYSRFVEGGFGTGDCVIVADGMLHVVDYKHGKGVRVFADDNSQMMLYALGALELYDDLYDISTVSMTIYQPRRYNVSTFKMTKDALCRWAEKTLKPAAALAYAGEGEYQCGDWCGFCKARATCCKRAESNLALAKYDFRLPPLLEDNEIESILLRVDELVSWGADVKDYALKAALGGKKWCTLKLVEGRANRKYTNENLVAATVTAAGYDPYERKVRGVTAMEKMLGKSKFGELLGGLTVKPRGRPALVPKSDDRPEINTAENDFSEENDND
ncbi:MAG: DUF2800 domain-containing protein [Clostridia bacterium]